MNTLLKINIKKNTKRKMTKFNSTLYWQNRYENGGNSGLGSRGELAQYKANYINDFIIGFDINSMTEYGCGDGYNLSLIECNKIIGLDISTTAINHCKQLMPQHTFINIKSIQSFKHEPTDLIVSLDVLYHLIEDNVYEHYMTQLVHSNSKYIIIYAPTYDEVKDEVFGIHVKPRDFTNHSLLNQYYTLIKTEQNKFKSLDHTTGSFSDWFIYLRKN